jgi:Ca-activated chloride channel homolog
MSFVSPVALLALVVVPLAVALYLLVQRRRQRYAVRFTNLDLLANVVDESPGWRRHVPAVLYLLALTALVLAFARPQATVSVPKEQATVMLVTDISGSMNATDVDPTRLGAAQNAAIQLLDRLPKTFRVGLISFSNSVNTLVAPTTDRTAVKQALLGLKPNGGTAMGDAIAAALQDIKAADATNPVPSVGPGTPVPTPTPTPVPVDANGKPVKPTNVIVLLSDGANTLGVTKPMDAADEAKAENVPIYTIALGTDSGVAEVTDQAGRLRRVPVPPDPDTLKQISDATGGKSFQAPTAEDLQAVYKDIGSKLAHQDEKREIAYVFAGIGALLLLAGAGASLMWFNRFP